MSDEHGFDCAARAREKSDGVNNFERDIVARGKEMYTNLFRRLNKRMKTTSAGTSSGFEVFRRTVREEVSITESTEYGPRLFSTACVTAVQYDFGRHAPLEDHRDPDL